MYKEYIYRIRLASRNDLIDINVLLLLATSDTKVEIFVAHYPIVCPMWRE